MPYSGPASAYGVIGKTEAAYFKMLNESGGVNGRKLNLISLDDGYSPPKTVEQTRRLVEQEQVAFMFQTLGTPSNAAIRPYLNENKVPQLFVATGASMWNDPKNFPWTIGFNPNYQTEARIYGQAILQTAPGAKIGVLYQNDGFGKDYLIGLKDGLGADHAAMIVKEASYEVSEPTIDSQIVSLQDSGADTFLIAATPKFAAQAIRKSYDIGWKATRYLSNVSPSVATVLKPAGLEKSKGLITAYYGKDPTDARWKDDAGYKEWAAFATKYLTPTDLIDANAAYAADPDAQAVRERPLAREHHEAGGQHQGSRAADAASRHEDQHLARQFLADPADAARQLQRGKLDSVRRAAAGVSRARAPRRARRRTGRRAGGRPSKRAG
jgi:branched-chain amino acid transport system substrate-binding protein